MLSSTPPAFLIGMVLQVLWIPIRMLPVPGRTSFIAYSYDLGLAMAGALLVIIGIDQLRRRARMPTTCWLGLALALQCVLFTIQVVVFVVYERLRLRPPLDTMTLWQALTWVMLCLTVVLAVALALAAGRKRWLLGVLLVVAAFVMTTPSSLQRVVAAEDVMFIAMLVARLVFALAAVVIAEQIGCSIGEQGARTQTTERYAGAIRALRWLAISLGARGLVLLATAFVLRGTSHAHVRIALDGLDLVTACVIAWALIAIARAQLSALSPYAVLLAVAAALNTVVVLTYPTRWIAEVFSDHAWMSTERFLTAIPIACELPMVGALGALTVVLWRARVHVVVGCIVWIAAVVAALVAHRHEVVWFGSLAVATVSLVPAIWTLRRRLIAEPIKTTVDVFA